MGGHGAQQFVHNGIRGVVCSVQRLGQSLVRPGKKVLIPKKMTLSLVIMAHNSQQHKSHIEVNSYSYKNGKQSDIETLNAV